MFQLWHANPRFGKSTRHGLQEYFMSGGFPAHADRADLQVGAHRIFLVVKRM